MTTTQNSSPKIKADTPAEAHGTRVEFKHVNKVFTQKDRELKALDDVNLIIEPGTIMGIIGYSGAGKSTLVRQINGLDKPTSGEIFLDFTDIVPLSEAKLRAIRPDIGMIFQQFNLFNNRTIAKNVAYPLKLNKVPKTERQQRVQELLDFVGLGDKANYYPDQLSGGQKQRVGIARALANNPRMLLADEATSALDPETTAEVLSLLHKINEELGITIVMITHEMDVVRAICNEVAVMENGRVVEHGSVYEIFAHPQTPVAQKFVATSLRNTPDTLEVSELTNGTGRLFTITMQEGIGFFDAVSKAGDAGVSVNIVHGGVTTLDHNSFGKFTLRMTPTTPESAEAIDTFFNTMHATTEIQEIK